MKVGNFMLVLIGHFLLNKLRKDFEWELLIYLQGPSEIETILKFVCCK